MQCCQAESIHLCILNHAAYNYAQNLCLGDYGSMQLSCIKHRTRTAYAVLLWELFTACNHARRTTRPRRVSSASVLLHVDRLSSLIHGRLLSSPSGSSCEARLLPRLVCLLLQSSSCCWSSCLLPTGPVLEANGTAFLLSLLVFYGILDGEIWDNAR